MIDNVLLLLKCDLYLQIIGFTTLKSRSMHLQDVLKFVHFNHFLSVRLTRYNNCIFFAIHTFFPYRYFKVPIWIKMTISIKSFEHFLDIQLNSREEWHSSNTDCVSMNRGRKYIIMSFQEID